MKLKSLLCAALFVLSGITAYCQTIELTPFYGYRWGGECETPDGEELDFDNSEAYGLVLDFGPKDSEIKMEFLWSRQDGGLDFDGTFSADMTVDEFMVGGIYEERYGNFRGYLSLLLGASLFDVEGFDSELYFSTSIGGGVKYFITPNIALRADVRGYCTITDSEAAFISTGGTTVVYFAGDALWQGEVTAGVTIAF
jgi:hypothetical protein